MWSSDVSSIDPKWPWANGLSFAPAVRAGDVIYVSGQLSLDPAGALVGDGDMEAQSRRIFSNIDEILRAGGSSISDVVRLTCYCLSFSDYREYSRVRNEVFGEKLPASTTVGVSSFLMPGALLEVDAIAFAGHEIRVRSEKS